MTKKEQMYREERQLKAIVRCNLLTTDCVTTGTNLTNKMFSLFSFKIIL